MTQSQTASAINALTGQFALAAGGSPSIRGRRGVLGTGVLDRLLRGQRCDAAQRTLGQLFSLCGHAHERCCALAFAAARPGAPGQQPVPSAASHRLETARDHLRCMALDWPQQLAALANPAQALDWLGTCPVALCARSDGSHGAATEQLAQLRQWLEEQVLRQPVASWLKHFSDPQHWTPAQLSHGLSVADHGLPYPLQLLINTRQVAGALRPVTRLLPFLHPDAPQQSRRISAVAHTLANEDNFMLRPHWLGQCAETGPWARARHFMAEVPDDFSAWHRLRAHWFDLLEIADAPALEQAQSVDRVLCSGAVGLGEGRAIAWCEMARGLLLHWVQLDHRGAVAGYRLVAPTEWNFHPQGALAQALGALQPHDLGSARLLAAAFDPCVQCSIESGGEQDGSNA